MPPRGVRVSGKSKCVGDDGRIDSVSRRKATEYNVVVKIECVGLNSGSSSQAKRRLHTICSVLKLSGPLRVFRPSKNCFLCEQQSPDFWERRGAVGRIVTH